MTSVTGAALALVVGATLASPAAARPGPDSKSASGGSERITITGTCDAGSRWTLSGRSRFLQIEVEGRVEAQRRRKKSRWTLRLVQNQNTVAVTSRRSSGGGAGGVERHRLRARPTAFFGRVGLASSRWMK